MKKLMLMLFALVVLATPVFASDKAPEFGVVTGPAVAALTETPIAGMTKVFQNVCLPEPTYWYPGPVPITYQGYCTGLWAYMGIKTDGVYSIKSQVFYKTLTGWLPATSGGNLILNFWKKYDLVGGNIYYMYYHAHPDQTGTMKMVTTILKAGVIVSSETSYFTVLP